MPSLGLSWDEGSTPSASIFWVSAFTGIVWNSSVKRGISGGAGFLRPGSQTRSPFKVYICVESSESQDAGRLPANSAAGRSETQARERAEADLRHSREQLELVVRGANVGIWFCPLPFDKLIWDDKVKEHFHLPPDTEVSIELFYERLHPDDRERTRQAIDGSISKREA